MGWDTVGFLVLVVSTPNIMQLLTLGDFSSAETLFFPISQVLSLEYLWWIISFLIIRYKAIMGFSRQEKYGNADH